MQPIRYTSTRGGAKALSFKEVLMSGLAPDGGLYMPSHLPEFSKKEIATWKFLSYPELAHKIIAPFAVPTFSEAELALLLEQSYASFNSQDIAPIKTLSPTLHVLELFHGPTLAFKDFALQLLSRMLDVELKKSGEKIVILGATSGDTGSAAIAGCKGLSNIELFMLFPHNRISEAQRKQMTTQMASNIHPMAIQSHFDDCQDAVKHMFQHPDFLHGRQLVAVNSINWVRILAQIVYYFYAVVRLDMLDKPLVISVPTGNFGNVLAGFFAKKMGLSHLQFIVSTNENDILHRFFSQNDYSKRGVVETPSPSMDIQISSNFERLIYDIYDGNSDAVNALMHDFRNKGVLSMDEEHYTSACRHFSSCRVSNDDTKLTIKKIYEKHGYVIDPHTATGIYAAEKRENKTIPALVLATASYGKFMQTMSETLGNDILLPKEIQNVLNEKEERFTVVKNDLAEIKRYISETLEEKETT